MRSPAQPRTEPADALLAAAIVAIDATGIGISLRSAAGPTRDLWLGELERLLPRGTRLRRVPLHVDDGRLLGGIDLAGTLRAGRPVIERGILACSDGDVIVLPMAERLSDAKAALIGRVLDTKEVALEREGITRRERARLAVVALDEGADDEQPPGALLDRLALRVDLSALAVRDLTVPPLAVAAIGAARRRLRGVQADPDSMSALCTAAAALGIASPRAALAALRVARASAALAGRTRLDAQDLAVAARLVLAPRATALPAPAEPAAEDRGPEGPDPECSQAEEPERSGEPAEQPRAQGDADARPGRGRPDPKRSEALQESVLAAARAALPPHLLQQLKAGARQPSSTSRKCGAGTDRKTLHGGRPLGTQPGDPARGGRLNVLATLRAAAPWQRVRRARHTLAVRREDFRVTRFRRPSLTTTVFVVDASGSAAMHRLGEVKGAVELLLNECYVRRDRVALIAFRGREAQLLLPPTRSLVRVKRQLAALPGGGGTPLARGIEAAHGLAVQIRERGETPLLVILTDGRANIALDGGTQRACAERDAMSSARRLAAQKVTTMLVDTAPDPRPVTARLGSALDARYIVLPHVDAASLASAVRLGAPQTRAASIHAR